MSCPECQELKRHVIQAVDEHRQLVQRTRGRRASPPERRRIVRLRTDAYIARQLYENHRAVCTEEVA